MFEIILDSPDSFLLGMFVAYLAIIFHELLSAAASLLGYLHHEDIKKYIDKEHDDL